MAGESDMQRVQLELTEAYTWGDEARARQLVSRLGAQPRKARALFDDMLTNPDARVRQAAVFGLGELGGTASARRLKQQLAIEEARGDYDGEAVVEVITEMLGRIDEASTRATLVRRLERLTSGQPDPGDVHTVAQALWRKRHPDLLPAVRRSLQQLAPQAAGNLQGLLLLLEKSPEELSLWAVDPSVPVKHKMEVISVLAADVPEAMLPTLPSFISAAPPLIDAAVSHRGEAAYYCERLFRFLLLHKDRLLPTLPEASRSELLILARSLVPSQSPNCSFQATVLLQFIGRPEDAAVIEAHRPAEPVLAKVFDDAARALRGLHQG